MRYHHDLMQHIYRSLNFDNIARARTVHSSWLAAERQLPTNRRNLLRKQWELRAALQRGLDLWTHGKRHDVLIVEIPGVMQYLIYEGGWGHCYIQPSAEGETEDAPQVELTDETQADIITDVMRHVNVPNISIIHAERSGRETRLL